MTRHNLDEQLSWLLTNAGHLIPKLPKCMTADEHRFTTTNHAHLPEVFNPADRFTTHATPRVTPYAKRPTSKPPARDAPPAEACAMSRSSSLSAAGKPCLTATPRQMLTPASAVSQPGTSTEALKNGTIRKTFEEVSALIHHE